MIYFVTNNDQYYRRIFDSHLFEDITVVNEITGKELFYKLLGKQRILANDIEATGLDPYLAKPILFGLGNKANQFMFDWTCNVVDIFEHIKKYNIIQLGHNLLYDFGIIKAHTGILLERCYDTMLAEQRLWMRLGYEYTLAAVTERYLEKARAKETRNDFINADLTKFKLAPNHIYYLRDDLVDLFDIRKKQVPIIKKFKMEFLIYGIEFPLIHSVAESELKGFVLNEDTWRARIKAEKAELFELQCKLDEYVKAIRDFKSKDNPQIREKLVGGKYDNKRVLNPLYDIFKPDGTTTETNLFDEPATKLGLTKVKKKVVAYPNNINYSSPTEVIKIFAALEEPLLNKAEKLEVPMLIKKSIGTKGGFTYRLAATESKFELSKKAFNQYLIMRPDTIMKEFIKGLIKLGELEKSISTYGENFISKIHPVTGRIHTKFRQCDADTGRYQSGGGKRQPDKINIQNIPAKKEIRNAFGTDPDKEVCTSDYTGAELLVMASHAQDFKLIQLNNEDMHSYMATKCWRAIYARRAMAVYDRYKVTSNPEVQNKLVEDYRKLKSEAETFTVSKETKELRTNFKPMTFGTIYGMYAKKAGVTLNIPKEEGQVVINVIKGELPLTFEMVERASKDAERQGYVILNDRTNSRMWFYPLIEQIKGRKNKDADFKEISEELSAARNGRIQGTQADFVKEASVVLRKHVKKNKLDCTILAWVHDEIVDEYDKRYKTAETIPQPLLYKGKKFYSYPEFKTYIMEEVANRYLHNVTIHVETESLPYWTK